MIIKATFPAADLNHQRVFLRADLNVPLHNGTIIDDYRLTAILPTINALSAQGARIILATHIGRPTNNDPALSTRHLIAWFTARGYDVTFAPTIAHAYELSTTTNHRIILLENLRFFPGEQTAHEQFAHELAHLADYYINDAFATLHRNDTSITLVPRLFSAEKRSIGLLIERELKELSHLIDHPQQPFVICIGGGKARGKIPLIQAMLGKAHTIILCPAVVFTFLKAIGKPTGLSLVDHESIAACKQIMMEAPTKNTALIFPTDYIVAHGHIDGAQSTVLASHMPADGVGISFGPQTMAQVKTLLSSAQTIFYNGLMGDEKYPETITMMQELLQTIAHADGLSIIGGGDTVAVARNMGIDNKIGYLSTGGGATLALLANQPLPGLAVFLEDRTKTK